MTTHTRLWDAEYKLLYSSETDPRTPEQFMLDQGFDDANITIDQSPKGSFLTRWGGKLVRVEDGTFQRVSHHDLLKHIVTPVNPFFKPN